jgi:putative ABC transport system permease protein
LHERWSSLPGVDSVGIGVSSGGQKSEFWTASDGSTVEVRAVGCGVGDENYLKTMGARLIAGRYLEKSDIGEDRRTLVINERMAGLCRLGEHPIGKIITRVTGQGNMSYEVVGVVGDLRDSAFGQKVEPTYYRPYQGLSLGPPQFIAVRTKVEPAAIFRSLRNQLKDLEPAVGAPAFEIVENALYDSTWPQRIYMKCLTLFAAVRLSLAVLGIYGVLAYSVERRTKEMGIRIALGALPSDIVCCTVWESVRAVCLGVTVGLLGTFWLSRFVESLLFEVSPHDPVTLASGVIVFLVVAALAAWLPARRATKINPMVALREE